ncbi:hypothetical protein BLNAU_6445 [Blattamonas nauphoetae]|uniref:EF-hand domain-containing protein n=1 Tax=Blattamonas nauphoetae TaxID=2049346 RepID=A0ABQ9Y4J5_9EUKA|nr:hypothetical protein BLNAU_6445 [Blattamonas nauphoetae]
MTMKPNRPVKPGTLHFPPHLTGSAKPAVLNEREIQIAFDYLSRGKGFIAREDLEETVKGIKPTSWPQFSDLIEPGERITYDQLMNQLRFFEAGSFDCVREAFNLFRGERNDPLSMLMRGAAVAEAKPTDTSIPIQNKDLLDGGGKKKTRPRLDEVDLDELSDSELEDLLSEEDRIKREEEARKQDKELAETRQKEEDSKAKAQRPKPKFKGSNIITANDICEVMKRLNPGEEFDEEDLLFLSKAPDLDGDGVISFNDFSRLFDEWSRNGLHFGDPILPSELDLVIPPDDPVRTEAKGARNEMRLNATVMEQRMVEEARQKKLQQEEESKRKEEEEEERPKEEDEIDPRYADLPKLFEKKLLERHRTQARIKRGMTMKMSKNAEKQGQQKRDDLDDDDDDIDM